SLSVAGGLLSIPSADVTLGTNAATAKASGTRAVSIPSIEVLNLGAVLQGLGITLADLPLDDLLALLDSLGLDLPNVTDPAAVVGLVSGLLATLDDTALLSVHGIQLGVVADATSSVESSVADVTGTIGSVKVGNITVPGLSGLDLTAPANVLSAAGDTVSTAIGNVLSVVNAQLADLVDVDVLKISELVGA